jgi:hypothetical protein
MLRRLALAALLLGALPSSALANPSLTVSSSEAGPLNRLPASVTHRLMLTAAAAPEQVRVVTTGTMTVSGDGVTQGVTTAVGPSVFACAGRWEHPHEVYREGDMVSISLTIAPFATATVDVTRTFVRAPWAGEDLAATWDIEPPQGSELLVNSVPTEPYTGPTGVQLGMSLIRVARRVYAVAGTADSGVDSGRVELFGYAPGRKHARRLAVARVHHSAWAVRRLRLPRRGLWEFYARYRTATKAFADDASVCGTLVGVH